MPRVNCKHFLGCCSIKDTKTGNHIDWLCDCEIFGNEQLLGYDCGKGWCQCYKRKDKEVKE